MQSGAGGGPPPPPLPGVGLNGGAGLWEGGTGAAERSRSLKFVTARPLRP